MEQQRISSFNHSIKRDIPSFIEPPPPLISNPFMRPKPVKGTNLLEKFDEDSECEEPELVQVYLRLKPCEVASNLYEVRSDQCLITSMDTTTAGHGRRTQHKVSKMYTFSRIFSPNTSQKEIFENVVKENLRKLPEGQSYTLLTYGASGSGKTYTLMGTVQSPGLVPRSLEYLFKVVEASQHPLYKPSESGPEKLSTPLQDYELQWVKKLCNVSAPLRDKYRRMSAHISTDLTNSCSDLSARTKHYVWVSFVEIYNEAVYDLLVTGDRRSANKLRIREDATGNVYVKGASQVFVRSGSEAYAVLAAGKHQLQVAATGVHAHSSRSHCIFTITLLAENEGSVRTSLVRLCDLAGAERVARTQNSGARMAESRAINSSLHVLERCLHILRRRRPNGLVPYRESKLTRLLGAGLSGGEAVSMVVTVNPHPQYHSETKHVLQLAAVARDIQVNSTIAESTQANYSQANYSQDNTVYSSDEVIRLRSDNERLHFELVQAQARQRELLYAMEEKQQEVANTMSDLVEEAKDITKQYYEAQLTALENRHRAEIEDLTEEYESKLNNVSTPTKSAATPQKNLQNMITQLTTEITILEEKLTAERLARARAEDEVQHLRACIEERDHEKALEEYLSEEQSERDSLPVDSESSNVDEMNESLEPSFRQEQINASKRANLTTNNNATIIVSESEDVDTTLETSIRKSADLNKSSKISINDTNDCGNETARNDSALGDDTLNDNSDKISDKVHEIDNKRGTYVVNSAVIKEKNSLELRAIWKDTEIETEEFKERRSYFGNDKDGTPRKEFPRVKKRTYFFNDIVDNTSIVKPTDAMDKIDYKLDDVPAKKKEDLPKEIKEKLLPKEEMKEKILPKEEEQPRIELPEAFGNIKMLTEKRTFFDYVSENVTTAINKVVDTVKSPKVLDDLRSPSIVKDNMPTDYELTTIKKLLGDSWHSSSVSIQSVNNKVISKIHDSIDLFEEVQSPIVAKDETEGMKDIRKSVKKMSKDEKDVSEEKSVLPQKPEEENKEHDKTNSNVTVSVNNTDIDFENIYKDITAPRATEFELLLTQDDDTTNNENVDPNATKNLMPENKSLEKETEIEVEIKKKVQMEINDKTKQSTEMEATTEKKVKYNLRNKTQGEEDIDISQLLLRTKRKLRLRRCRNQVDIEDDKEFKLKDIGNLKTEFSDVMMDVPPPKKEVKDIPSPEKCGDENMEPMSGMSSCPSKSVTRSRRKLFTPRAEPLDEGEVPSAGSGGKPTVPRPSYHKGRARRKL